VLLYILIERVMYVLGRSFNNRKLGFFSVLLFSLFLCIGLTFLTYKLFSWYEENALSEVSLVLFASLFSGILYIAILVVLLKLLKNISEQQLNARELKNFKNFTDVIHRAETEIEVYESLYTFVNNMHLVSHVTLFYRKDISPKEISWLRLTNERMPLCTMEPRNCPLFRFGRECCVKNIAADITCAYQLPEHKYGSYICLPITEGPVTLGILQLYSKAKYFFDENTISKLKSYIEVARPIISSRRAMHQLNKEASTDQLTKLYNRSFLDSYLQNQIEVASLSKQPLSLIMLDIDDFKKVNDTYGHQAGDAVLVVFSQVILRCVRRTDLVTRYGGEEFIAVLPATNTERAVSIAERIRETIAMETMPKINNVQLPNITCSIGVSTYPLFADDKEKLIKTADIALYKAKAAGKNRVILYSNGMGL
jgi:diguanylate cyclase (GGDEF)-like protein